MFEDDDENATHTRDWIDEALDMGMGFKSPEERQAYIDSLGDPCEHPMFATSTESLKGNPLTEAFRSLREENKSFVELVHMYKEEGNEWIKKKTEPITDNLHQAFERYTHSLAILDQADNARKLGGPASEPDIDVDLEILRSQILGNRSLVHLNLKNYGYCIKDTELSIKHWPENMKSHWRRCKSYYMLKKYNESFKACLEALKYDKNHVDILDLSKKCGEELKKTQEISNKKKELIIKEEKKWMDSWDIAIFSRVKLGYSSDANSGYDAFESSGASVAIPHYDAGVISWPVLILYPEHNKLDIIQGACGDDMIALHLSNMFPELEDIEQPLDWDPENKYVASNLVIYIQLNSAPVINNKEEWKRLFYERKQIKGIMEIELPGSTEKSKLSSEERQKSHDIANEKKCELYMEVFLGCTILNILQAKNHVISGGLLTLIAFVKNSKAHKNFLKDALKKSNNDGSIRVLNP